MNEIKMKSDLKKLGKIDYAKINVTEDIDLMAKSLLNQNVRFQESRLITILKEIFSKEEFDQVQNLLRANNKSVLGVFLKEKNIEITMDNRKLLEHFSTIDLYVTIDRGTDNELTLFLSDSEEAFKKSLIGLKENYKNKRKGA